MDRVVNNAWWNRALTIAQLHKAAQDLRLFRYGYHKSGLKADIVESFVEAFNQLPNLEEHVTAFNSQSTSSTLPRNDWYKELIAFLIPIIERTPEQKVESKAPSSARRVIAPPPAGRGLPPRVIAPPPAGRGLPPRVIAPPPAKRAGPSISSLSSSDVKDTPVIQPPPAGRGLPPRVGPSTPAKRPSGPRISSLGQPGGVIEGDSKRLTFTTYDKRIRDFISGNTISIDSKTPFPLGMNSEYQLGFEYGRKHESPVPAHVAREILIRGNTLIKVLPRYIDINLGKAKRWLLLHPNEVKVDKSDDLLFDISYGYYGGIDGPYMLDYFDLTPSQLRAIDLVNDNFMDVYDVSPSLAGMDAISVSEIIAMQNYLSIILSTGKKPDKVPTVVKFPRIELVYDKGVDNKQPGGFPRLILKNDRLTVSTQPYGLGRPVNNILEVDGLPFSVAYNLRNVQLTPRQNRNLAYHLSLYPNLRVVVNPSLQSSYDGNVYKLYTYIENLAQVLYTIFRTDNLDDIRNRLQNTVPANHVGIGPRWRLLRYLEEHPDVAAKLRAPHTGNLPFAIEDYIPSDVWAKIPVEIKEYGVRIPIVPNPYLLLTATSRSQIGAERGVPLTAGQEAKELQALDEILPEWRDATLATRETEFRQMTTAQRWYYLAAMGYGQVSPPPEVDPTDFWLFVLEIVNAGGLGQDEKDARPTHKTFLDEINVFLSTDREVLKGIMRFFKVDEYELLDDTAMKEIIIRGYINPLPISDAARERYTLWKSLNDDKKLMIARYYGIDPSNTAGFISKTNPSPYYEQYVKAIDEKNLDEIIQNLQMRPPAIINRMTYVADSLEDVDLIFNRVDGKYDRDPLDKRFHQEMDAEIIEAIGAIYPYQSRRELIENGIKLVNGAVTFFIPVNRACKNSYDPVTADDTSSLEVFVVAYGTIDNYICLTPAAIALGFSPYGDHGEYVDYRVIREDNTMIKITDEQASWLGDLMNQVLLDNLSGVSEAEIKRIRTALQEGKAGNYSQEVLREIGIREILENIQKVDLAKRAGNEYARTTLAKFQTFKPQLQVKIREFFNEFFYTGMYMRRWRGPPNPFPYNEADTKRSDFDKDLEVVPHLSRMAAILEELRELDFKLEDEKKAVWKTVTVDEKKITRNRQGVVTETKTVPVTKRVHVSEAEDFVRNLRRATMEFRYVDGTEQGIDVMSQGGSESTIQDLIVPVIFGQTAMVMKSCIRVNSTNFLSTANVYLLLFWNYKIPGYDPKLMKYIM